MIQNLEVINSENEILQIPNQQPKHLFEEIQEGIEYLMGNSYKTFYKVQLSNEGTLMYIKDGEIIRIDKRYGQMINPAIITNLEQIKHLVWDGEYNEKNQRVGKWRALWKNYELNAGGSYNENGEKVGMWIELFENFWENGQITFIGEYKNNKRYGKWNFYFKEKTIGGGIYDENGEKTGVWVELDTGFSCLSQISYHGIYASGIKQGQWTIKNKDQQIGGGFYDEKGIKFGKWIDISKHFQQESQIIYCGEYYEGKRYNRWDIMFREEQLAEFKKIGGGMYDLHGLKDNMWTEVHDSFQNDCKTFFVGQYLSGKKIGKWNAIYQDNIIGGGCYDDQGMKTGKWVDLNSNFFSYSQLIFSGKYINGKRQERWEVLCRYDPLKQFQPIGGGYYDEKGIKYDMWIEPIEHIWSLASIIYKGQYQNNEQKFGKWDILYKEENSENFQLIGGGFYDEYGLKSGEWAEVDQRFSYSCQVIQKGKYLKGRKVGRWNSHFWEKIIGGGVYDEDGQKNGQWIDLDENFSYIRQLVWIGVYNNGFRIGQFKENNLQ